LAELKEHTHSYEISSAHFDNCVFSAMTLHENMDDVYFGITDDTKPPTGKKVLKNVAYVPVTPEISIIAYGTNDKHYEGKNK
jgi:hypothetical protein